MTKCVIYTCFRETFPHLNAVAWQRKGRGWERGVEPIVDILIYNSLFMGFKKMNDLDSLISLCFISQFFLISTGLHVSAFGWLIWGWPFWRHRYSNILRRKGRWIPMYIQCAKNSSVNNIKANTWLTFTLNMSNDAGCFVEIYILCFSLRSSSYNLMFCLL